MKIRSMYLSILCLLNTICCVAQFAVKGKCIDEKSSPVIGANVAIFGVQDTGRIVKEVTTNQRGEFICDGLPGGRYILQLSMVGYIQAKQNVYIYRNIDLGFITLKENAKLLNNIVVTADILKSYGNKDEIFLPERNRKIGTNAFDAISSLPQFKKNYSTDELETTDRRSVLVLIDGRRSSAKELSLLKSDEIKKLNFYSEPPVRYAHENVGAVLEVITKRKTDKQYSLYLSTKNSFTTGYGTNVANIMFADSLNQLSASYFIDYRSLNKNLMNNTYQYGNNSNYYDGEPGTYIGQYHIGQLTYQRNKGNNMFNAKLEYRKNPGREKYNQQVISGITGNEYTGTSGRKMISDYDSWSLDLYFMKNFTGTRTLSFNAVNTYYKSSSDNTLSRIMSGQPSMNYSYENRFKNISYSLITEVLYSDKLWKGDWDIGAYFRYKNLHQTFNNNDKSNLNYKKEYVYTDYSNKCGKLSYMFGLGIENIAYHTVSGDNYNYLVVKPSVSLNYKWSKTLSSRLNSSVKSQIPDVGYLTNSIESIDENFFSEGNTNLKSYYYYNNELKFQFMSGDNKLFLSPSIFYNYYVHPNASILMKENKNIYMQYARLDNDMNELGCSVTGSYSPAQWITVQPFYNYSYKDYRTPNNLIKHSINNAGVSLQFVLKELQVAWSWDLPFTSVDGDIYNKDSGNIFMSVLWKHKSISLGAEWISELHPSFKVYGKMNGFHYNEETVWNNFKSLVDIKFTYYLSKGKSRNHTGKKISNSDSDSGLVISNTAK